MTDRLTEVDLVDLSHARSSQRVPPVALGQVLLPPSGVVEQPLVVPIEAAEKLKSFQGVDGFMHDVDDGGLTSLGQ